MRYMGRGHTDGDAVIYFPDLRTVHTGDLVVWGKRSQGATLPDLEVTALVSKTASSCSMRCIEIRVMVHLP